MKKWMVGTVVVTLAVWVICLAPPVEAQALEEKEWSFEEDVLGGAWEITPELQAQMESYAARLYRNRDRAYEQMIEGFGYLRELSFNESMREVEKDFFELLGEALGGLIIGNLGDLVPKVAGLKLVDLPKLIPLIEAWGEEISPSSRRETVGEFVQGLWDRFRREKASLPDPDELVAEMSAAYLALDLDGQIEFESWLEEVAAMEAAYREPDPLLVEQKVWEQWVNAHFVEPAEETDLARRKCRGTGGCMELWLEASEYAPDSYEFHLAAAELVVPGSDVVSAGMHRIIKKADAQDRGAWRRRVKLLSFAVPKRVCFGDYFAWSGDAPGILDTSPLQELGEGLLDALGVDEEDLPAPPCGWLGPANETLTSPEDPEIRRLFESISWRHGGAGSRFGVHGWD